MKSKSDEQLVMLCKQGSEQAIEILFVRYKGFLQKIIRGYFLLGSDDDDLMQEAMIGLYKAIVSFKEGQESSFKTFATLCVRRNVLDAIKKSNAQKHKVLNNSISLSGLGENEDDDLLYVPYSSQSTDEQLEQSQVFDEVVSSITKKLSALELEILKEYLKGSSYQFIAGKLNINTKSVDNALSRIKSKLQFLL